MLDSSGSMSGPAGGGQTKLRAAKEALGRLVAGTPSQVEHSGSLSTCFLTHRALEAPLETIRFERS